MEYLRATRPLPIIEICRIHWRSASAGRDVTERRRVKWNDRNIGPVSTIFRLKMPALVSLMTSLTADHRTNHLYSDELKVKELFRYLAKYFRYLVIQMRLQNSFPSRCMSHIYYRELHNRPNKSTKSAGRNGVRAVNNTPSNSIHLNCCNPSNRSDSSRFN